VITFLGLSQSYLQEWDHNAPAFVGNPDTSLSIHTHTHTHTSNQSGSCPTARNTSALKPWDLSCCKKRNHNAVTLCALSERMQT
jgi:hypothetical protein